MTKPETSFKFGTTDDSMEEEDYAGDLIEEEISNEQSEMIMRRYSVQASRRSTVVGIDLSELNK
jgi:hypothetical protein